MTNLQKEFLLYELGQMSGLINIEKDELAEIADLKLFYDSNSLSEDEEWACWILQEHGEFY